MTRRQRRLIGRAHRRQQQGVPLTSQAAHNTLVVTDPRYQETFASALQAIRTAWEEIRDAAAPAIRCIYALTPPTYHRPAGPLIHQGRKHP